MPEKTTMLAFCGKGGVGKTSLSALTVKLLAAAQAHRVLAIDADPAMGLSFALGIPVTRTVDDIRNWIIRQLKTGVTAGPQELIAMLDYEMLSALGEKRNLAFLAIGRPETDGCYCQVNHLLKEVIAAMAESFDFVVIDGEAGIEQVNRRVLEKVSHLVLVSDGSAKGLNVVRTLGEVAGRATLHEKAGLIVNRLKSADEWRQLRLPPGIEPLGWIPEDETIRTCDMLDQSLFQAEGGEALNALAACLETLGIPVPANPGQREPAHSGRPGHPAI